MRRIRIEIIGSNFPLADRSWHAGDPNREVTTACTIPGRLLVLGGGVVGVEMAQAYTTLRSRVTVIEASERLPRGRRSRPRSCGMRWPAAASMCGTGVRAVAVLRTGPEVTVTLSDGQRISGDEILVATDRQPRARDPGLETVGLRPGQPVEVGEQLARACRGCMRLAMSMGARC